MTTTFRLLWAHIHVCDVCNKLDYGLCLIGDRLLDEAIAAGKRARA